MLPRLLSRDSLNTPASWPGLSRPSTSFAIGDSKDVDARDKPGHDEKRLLGAMFTASGGLRNRADDGGFHDRQVDQGGQHAEQHRQPPDRRVGTELLEHDAAQPHAKESADLMADEGKTVEGG